jgi:16S rRNA pseudouridine516 synthase
MKLVRYLSNLGYGSRREVSRLIAEGRVRTASGDRLEEDSLATHAEVRIDDAVLDPPPGSVAMLHKPIGFVCSTQDPGRLIYELLPGRFPLRSPAMTPVGRLDRDTSGLLLLTDDGQLSQRIRSPRAHLTKVYEVTLAEPIRGDESDLFRSGTLCLRGERTPLLPASLEIRDSTHVRVTLTEGRYHQVRRMFAAVGNHVLGLHRRAVGPLELGDLPAGCWRLLSEQEVSEVEAATRAGAR